MGQNDLMKHSFIDMTPIIQFADVYWKYSVIGLVFALVLLRFTARDNTLRIIFALIALVCIFNIVVAWLF